MSLAIVKINKILSEITGEDDVSKFVNFHSGEVLTLESIFKNISENRPDLINLMQKAIENKKVIDDHCGKIEELDRCFLVLRNNNFHTKSNDKSDFYKDSWLCPFLKKYEKRMMIYCSLCKNGLYLDDDCNLHTSTRSQGIQLLGEELDNLIENGVNFQICWDKDEELNILLSLEDMDFLIKQVK